MTVNGVELASIDWAGTDLGRFDVVVVLTAHAGYDWRAIVARTGLLIDTRNATAGHDARHVIRI